MVDVVIRHKITEMLEAPILNADGRATSNHQSLYDLQLQLAASGAQMLLGCSVHGCAQGLMSMWWCPTGHNVTVQQEELCEAIFYDIVEARHMKPRQYRDYLEAAAGICEAWRAAIARVLAQI